jgi:hypothetical protein
MQGAFNSSVVGWLLSLADKGSKPALQMLGHMKKVLGDGMFIALLTTSRCQAQESHGMSYGYQFSKLPAPKCLPSIYGVARSERGFLTPAERTGTQWLPLHR